MINKIIKWIKRNPCEECDYYKPNGICQSKKVITCGNHPYVNFIDRLFCEPYKAESEEANQAS